MVSLDGLTGHLEGRYECVNSAPVQRPSDAYGVDVVLVMPCCTAGVQFSLTVCHGGYGHEVLRLFRCTLINATDMVMIDRVPRQ